MEMDLEQQPFSAEKYDTYILGSAQVVGLMCLRVFTDNNDDLFEALRDPAMKLGSAFQKVNFLRDISADYHELNRTYFPGVDLKAFSASDKLAVEQDIENEFCEALTGIRQLPYSARRGVYLAYVYYRKLFYKLSRVKPEAVMSERIRISNGHKLWLMCGSYLRFQIGAL